MSGLFLLLLGGAALAYAVYDKRRTDEAWRKLAEFLGLQVVEDRRLAGAIEGHEVRVDTVTRGSGKSRRTYFRVVVPAPLAAWNLSIKAEGGWRKLEKWLGREDVRVMDDRFDAAMHVQGDEVDAVALLDHAARSHLHAFVQGRGGELAERELRWEAPASSSGVWSIAAVVESAVALAKALDVDLEKPAPRLAKNALDDPDDAVRRRNLELLAKHFPSEAAPVAERLLYDKDDRLRLVSAHVLGDERVFETLSFLAWNARLPEDRASALEALLSRFPYERVSPLLPDILAHGPREVLLLALRAIGEHGDVLHREAVEACVGPHEPDVHAAIATTLGRLGEPASERVLVTMLDWPDDEVKLAAVRALGELASVGAVEALLPISKGFSLDFTLKSAAQDAIRRIQSRVGPVDGGRLSVVSVPEQEGALSLASEGGGLSLAEPDDGPLRGPGKVRG